MKTHSSILTLLLVIICIGVSIISTKLKSIETTVSTSNSDLESVYKYGVKILKQPSDAKLVQLDVASWPKWEGSESKFRWTFEATETMYIVEGKVKVYVEGHESEDEAFEIGAGDLVVFPKGMKVVWDITKAVKKHFSLDK